MLSTVRLAVDEGGYVPMGEHHGIKYEYSPSRTAALNGNRWFRLSGTIALPPQLYVAALLHPTEVGTCDATLRLNRVLHDFEDGKSRLFHLIAEVGVRPFFGDRDDCALSSYHVDEEDGTWWQFSTSVPPHVRRGEATIRLFTAYWGYRLRPFVTARGEVHTHFTLVTQTELNGWMPKALTNQIIPSVLADYVRTLESRLKEKLARRLPAQMLVESCGVAV
jgi:hypothetical protein